MVISAWFHFLAADIFEMKVRNFERNELRGKWLLSQIISENEIDSEITDFFFFCEDKNKSEAPLIKTDRLWMNAENIFNTFLVWVKHFHEKTRIILFIHIVTNNNR